MVRDFLVLVTLKNGINSFDDGPNKTGIIIVVSENSGPPSDWCRREWTITIFLRIGGEQFVQIGAAIGHQKEAGEWNLRNFEFRILLRLLVKFC